MLSFVLALRYESRSWRETRNIDVLLNVDLFFIAKPDLFQLQPILVSSLFSLTFSLRTIF